MIGMVSEKLSNIKIVVKNNRTRTGKTGVSQYTDIHPFTPVDLKYGDCVVHNQFSVHYSNENLTDNPRIAITCIKN
jgi:hypothetical protein